ncbi:hypothetical protein U879_08140 [Defluviimonas sp. 20V17]|uniref:Uncharacterized protein n=1 Tax=Allgaiera indica TaxID=765699 RepID=A0AAN4ZY38_9RHOB|nr:hypothetical protein [Allgaiera indica]KDB04192.1 hypothetical protein U879_08140 [Defluviimonas sp. 20V17]GHD99477.1 hypothetical protein GCM10008024_07010 [Allgaiera indica]SDW24911.1 hypothetical protein SAMN05444006_102175 [Allgaiera indica]
MTQASGPSGITQAFEAGSVDAAAFHHEQHVRVAFDLLRKYDFIDAAATYAKGLRAIAASAGAPEKFNLTITYAFLSLIAERLAASPDATFEAFVSQNPELLSKHLLEQWYGRERLRGPLARSVFLLPQGA